MNPGKMSIRLCQSVYLQNMSTVEPYDFEVLHTIPGAVVSIIRHQRYRWQRKEFVLLLLEDYDQNVDNIHLASAKLMMRLSSNC